MSDWVRRVQTPTTREGREREGEADWVCAPTDPYHTQEKAESEKVR
jgi:hypothetical protein